jgi:TPP-dependent pyruvate/acetoin dehydrogenase alpha subunit
MASYGNMRDAYSSIYSKPQPQDPISEALDTLLTSGIISEDELKSLMERKETPLEQMTRQLKVSNAPRVKPPNAPSKPLGDKKVPGMFDHSKRND